MDISSAAMMLRCTTAVKALLLLSLIADARASNPTWGGSSRSWHAHRSRIGSARHEVAGFMGKLLGRDMDSNSNTLYRQSKKEHEWERNPRKYEDESESHDRSRTDGDSHLPVVMYFPFSAVYDIEGGDKELIMELPGVSPENLRIEIENNSKLHISGFRRVRGGPDGVMEMNKFDETFDLVPSIDTSRITSSLYRGMLRVVLPRNPHFVRRIPVVCSDGKESTKSAALQETNEAV